MREAVIVEAVRTPIGRRKGKLSGVRPDDLLATVLQALVQRAKIDPGLVEDVIAGCVVQHGEQAFNIARMAALIAGFPLEVTGVTVDRQCGSSQQAANFAAQAIMAGAHDILIAAGVESLSREPMGSDCLEDPKRPFSPKYIERFRPLHQGISGEMIAERWKISRKELDELGLESHQKAAQATDSGYFRREILPIEVSVNGSKELFQNDEGIRRDTSLEKMAALQPAFKPDGVVTAGNSSQISDGAAALLIMEREKAKSLGLKPRARFVSFALAGVDPEIMLTGPIPATQKVLKKSGLSLSDIDLFEVNEAFASVVLAWKREIKPNFDRVNVNGGAIALGHPLGCTGARLLTTLLHELERREKRYGLATMCIGFGQGIATVIERIDS